MVADASEIEISAASGGDAMRRCPYCEGSLVVGDCAKRLRVNGAAIGLFIATVVGFVTIWHAIARRKLQRDHGMEAVYGVSLIVFGLVVAIPAILWYRKRREKWATWHANPTMPWLAWGPRLMVVCGFLVAGHYQSTVFWLNNVFVFGRDGRNNAPEIVRLVSDGIGGVCAAICLVGLAASETEAALSRWTQRALWVVCANGCVAAFSWVYTFIVQGLR
jgi:hypothetical protein